MEPSKKDFQILDALDSKEITTQRQLSEATGISLGQVNYVIKSLLEKGLIKIGNFQKNQNKIGYSYLLTSKGIETKSRLAVEFVTTKLKEYKELRRRLAEKLIELEQADLRRIIYIGPDIVKDLISTIIQDKQMKLTIIDSCPCLNDYKKTNTNNFDILLLFDGHQKSTPPPDIPSQKVITLW